MAAKIFYIQYFLNIYLARLLGENSKIWPSLAKNMSRTTLLYQPTKCAQLHNILGGQENVGFLSKGLEWTAGIYTNQSIHQNMRNIITAKPSANVTLCSTTKYILC